MSNSYINRRLYKTTSVATLTIDVLSTDMAILTAQAVGLTIASPTGMPDNGQRLIIRIKDNGTARAITWNAIFRAVGITLPTTTVLSKILYIGAIYNSDESKWDVLAVSQEV